MADTDEFTDSEIEALFVVDSGQARQHARCGALSGCRQRALAACDEDLDAWLARHPMDLPDLRYTPARAKPRG